MKTFKKRYHSDKEFRERHIKNVTEYNKTKKGKENQRKAREKLKEKGYFKAYMKEKREEAKKKGICVICFKNKPEKGKLSCPDCLYKMRKISKKRRERLKNHQK
jgi:hypothetical protein